MELIYFRKNYGLVSHGGTSRDNAFYNYIDNSIVISKKIVEINKKGIFSRMNNIIKILFLKNKILFFHLSILNTLFPSKKMKTLIGRMLFKLFFKKIIINNRIIIEINDLKWEQAKDLELKIKKREFKIQKMTLNIKNVEYVFASNEMKNYVIEKYNVNKKNAYVCINGGLPLELNNKLDKDKLLPQKGKLNFVYAGTLNKGRQIEKLIKIFKKLENKELNLILLGEGGEWLKSLSKNIVYLGNLPEVDAQRIVSLCDVGIVPYDSERFYYNLCYPTKNSFYITSGIPLLITPLKESMNVLFKESVLFVKKIEEWESFIEKLSVFEVELKKVKVKEIWKNYEWNFLIEKLFKEMRLL